MEKKLINYIAIMLVLLTSCSLNRDHVESDDHEASKDVYVKTINQYRFTLKPYSSQALAAVNYSDGMPEASRDSIISEYNDYLCFVFEIDIDGFNGDIADYEEAGKEVNYDEKVNYYLFAMQNDLKLNNGTDTRVPCTIYYYERLNEIAKTNRFIVGFKTKKAGDLSFEYNNPYFTCGKINFSIDTHHLALN